MTWVNQTPLENIPTHDADGTDWLDASKWVRNKSDVLAIKNGCWFDPEHAAWACWWMESMLRLYEDPFSGQPIRFLSTADDPKSHDGNFTYPWDVPDIEWDDGWELARRAAIGQQ